MTSKDEQKISWRFRLWWYRHRRHVIMRVPYGGAFCAKCKITAPPVYREDGNE